MTSTITSTGLGSGLDINGIVTKLLAAERTPSETRYTKQEATIQAKISSFGQFKSAVADFKNTFSALNKISNFQKISADSSDSASISASAFSIADPGTYKIDVKQLAQSHAIASKAYAEPSTVIGTGTLTINFGTTVYDPAEVPPPAYSFTQNTEKAPLSISIDSSNNTLAGIRDAINQANAGVTAAILNDGSGNRLVFNSTDTGAKNSLQIDVTETGTPGLADFAFNSDSTQMTQSQIAKDALVNINGLNVSSASNSISSALKGVSLNILQAQPGKIVTVNVARNSSDIATALESFVGKYNDLITSVNSLASYDAATKSAGILLGDSVLQSGIAQIRSSLTNTVEGLSGNIRSLTDVGIGLQKDGSLKFDSAKFNTAFTTDREAVTSLFSVLGRSSDTGVQVFDNSTDTKAGNFAINLTQAATQGNLTGATLAAAPLLIDASNHSFALKVDGMQSGSISLTQKTYDTHADLASEMQTQINASKTLKANGYAVEVSYDELNNNFTIKSKNYGASSQIEITSANATLGLSAATGTAGKDVQGTIDGIAATGKGQLLTAISGNAKGLQLFITDDNIGDRGTVNFGRGVVDRLTTTLNKLLNTGGAIDNRTSGLQKNLDIINASRTKLNDRLDTLQTRLLSQFNKMDALLGKLQTTGSFLNQQFNSNNKSSY